MERKFNCLECQNAEATHHVNYATDRAVKGPVPGHMGGYVVFCAKCAKEVARLGRESQASFKL